MSEFAWDPASYLALMAEEVPDYPRLQDELVGSTSDHEASMILDLGVGSGLTARRLADAHPHARLVGIDDSDAMLEAAARVLDPQRSRLLRRRLEDPLPDGPFDLVTTMLAVHHLDRAAKADLFGRVAAVLAPDGRFVLADLVVPEDPADAVTPVDGVIDIPSPLSDQVRWLVDAGLVPTVRWRHRDLAVVAAAPEPS